MVWQKKSTAPPAFSLGDEMSLLIAGDTSLTWLTRWLPLIGSDVVLTEPFCELGPPPTLAYSIAQFVSDISADPTDLLTQNEATVAVVRSIARQRAFAAFCESTTPGSTGTYGPDICGSIASTHGSFGQDAEHVIAVIPDGAVHAIGSITALSGGVAVMEYRQYVNGTGTGSGFLSGSAIGSDIERVIPAGMKSITGWLDGGPGTGTVCVRFDAIPPGTADFTAPSAPDPGVPVQPLTAADLAAIAAELDRQEAKLDYLLTLAQIGTKLQPEGPIGGSDAPVVVAPNVEMSVGSAIGYVVRVSGVPAGLDLAFGDPQEVRHMGRVNFGTPDGWYASVPLTHSPMVIRPLPAGATRYTVTGLVGGVTVTFAAIQPA